MIHHISNTMKSALLLLVTLLLASSSIAQIKAVTSTGEEVILNNDGTWKYSSAAAAENIEIAINPALFSKGKDATFQAKSTVVNAGIFLNPKKWSFKKGAADAAAEFNFELKGKDAYGMLISERIDIPLESLKNIAFDNAKSAAPDIAIVKQEYRTVNGRKILCMQMDGTVSGIKFTYLGYYYSSKSGAIQLLTYTSQNLLEEYRKDLEGLLNGLEITE